MKQVDFAFVSTMAGSPWGGSEDLWSSAALRLARQGRCVAARVNLWPEMPAPLLELQSAGCEVRRRPEWSRWRGAVDKLVGRSDSQWLNARQPRLVIISQGYQSDGVSWMELCHKMGVPFAMVTQAALEMAWPSDTMAARMRNAFLGARQCFFVSAGNLRLVERQIGIRLPNASVIRNPFRVSYDAPIEWPQEPPLRVASVGRLEPMAKGQDLLIESLAEERWRNREFRTTVYGNGPNRQSLGLLCETLRPHNLDFGGFVSNPEDIWSQCHILAMPSRYEGLPLALVEAMLCGRPAVATDVAGHAEVIEDGVTGFIAAAPSIASWSEAMERAWKARAEWREMGRKAAQRIRELVPPDPTGEFVKKLEELGSNV